MRPHFDNIRGAAALALAALPQAVVAQPLACTFTIVCAPEIECEALDDLPFAVGFEDGDYTITVEGEALRAAPVLAGDLLTLSFTRVGEALHMALAQDGQAVLTRHAAPQGPRLTATSFLGRCEPA